MESWETTSDLSTLTPRQRRQREIRDRERAICAAVGIGGVIFTSWGVAVRALAEQPWSITALAEALDWLDRESEAIAGAYSRADAALPPIGQLDPARGSAGQIARLLRVEAAVKLEVYAEHADDRVQADLRRWVVGALEGLGVRLPRAAEIGAARGLLGAIREYRLARRVGGTAREQYEREHLAAFGVSAEAI